MRYTKEQVLAAIKAIDFKSIRDVDHGTYKISSGRSILDDLYKVTPKPWPLPAPGETCEHRDADGELCCTTQASHYHPDPMFPDNIEQSYPVCKKHSCRLCVPPRKRKPS